MAQGSETNPPAQGPSVSHQRPEAAALPTVFEHSVVVSAALYQEVGLPIPESHPQPRIALPAWGGNIVKRLGRTILKPVLKLRPRGKVDWRNYGRTIGIMERYQAFILHDLPRLLEQEFGDATKEEWQRIEPRLGLAETRAHLVKQLNRPVTDTEVIEDLWVEVLERQFEYLEKLRQNALIQVATQRPKVMSLFFRGLAEGFDCFLDEQAGFCGDRGRTNIYLILLGGMAEVEKLRRTAPVMTRARYYDALTPVYGLSPKAYDWFNDVCDDIKFPLNELGRKRQSPAPVL